jgi:hypothetical protein
VTFALAVALERLTGAVKRVLELGARGGRWGWAFWTSYFMSTTPTSGTGAAASVTSKSPRRCGERAEPGRTSRTGAKTGDMAPVEVERTLVKSPPELWQVLAAGDALDRCLGDVRSETADAPRLLRWQTDVAHGVFELEAAGWGTKVRAFADGSDANVERRLETLLDELGSSALSAG